MRDEAAQGRDQRKLVPVTLDGVEPPLGFRQYHSINLSRWRGVARVRGDLGLARALSRRGQRARGRAA